MTFMIMLHIFLTETEKKRAAEMSRKAIIILCPISNSQVV